jgi:hypothetical protein
MNIRKILGIDRFLKVELLFDGSLAFCDMILILEKVENFQRF